MDWLHDKQISHIRRTGVQIGTRCLICKLVTLDKTGKIIIGNNVTISGKTIILSHDGSDVVTGKIHKGVTTIKDGAFIGLNAIVLTGVTIGSNAVVGAGSVVTKDIPNREIWAGNPAKKIGIVEHVSKENDENRHKLWKAFYRRQKYE